MTESFWDVYWLVTAPENARRDSTKGVIVRADLEHAVLGSATRDFATLSMASVQIEVLRTRWVEEMDSVYRVRVDPNTGNVEVVCLGMDSVDSEAEGIYDNTSLLPEWMQDKIAVLSMMKVDPPQTKIEGVGMRVDQHVFWVLKQ